MTYWSVAVVRYKHEAIATQNLVNQGFDVYAPRFSYPKVVRGKRRVIEAYLFSPYMFVGYEDQWRTILGTKGISSLLLQGSRPARIAPTWVADMRARENNGLVELTPRREPGKLVRIKHGTFAGYYGLYVGLSPRQREIVLLDALGRTELAAGDLDE